MTAKKKTSKKPTKQQRTASKNATPTKAKKRPDKKVAKAKPAPKRAEKKTGAATQQPRKTSKGVVEVAFQPDRRGPRSGEQSGDLQGLSRLEGADSESVDELIEEGNAFEADVVAGVESAGDADEREVRTHEVPEDDVPGEYLEKE
jgi:hypothetical protein